MPKRHRLAIHWFRRDLRLTDNTALAAAAAAAEEVLPVYIVSDWQGSHGWTGPNRQSFLAGSLAALEKNVEAGGGRMIFRRGRADEVLRGLIAETGADALHFNRDPGDPFGTSMERAVETMASGLGVAVTHAKDAVLHEKGEVLTGAGTPYRVYTPYSKNWNALPKPACGPRLKSLRSPAGVPSDGCPTLRTWGLADPEATIVEPGERAARERMKKALRSILPAYGERRNTPDGQTTSRLSQDLRFGLVSIRELHALVVEAMASTDSAAEKKSLQTYINELAWREFYFAILGFWPEVFEHEFEPQWRGLPWSYDDGAFERWKAGETGFPIVDAGMRELRATGFMHNRVRMITAMFLTKDLHLDWRLGEKFFMQQLVDGENAANNGGWQWSAGTGADAAPYFRIQNPWSQTKRYDPDGAYIRRWCPELEGVPTAALLEPPKAGSVKKGYPAPMVDHAVERERALETFVRHRERI